jgi:hypothetical protein
MNYHPFLHGGKAFRAPPARQKQPHFKTKNHFVAETGAFVR